MVEAKLDYKEKGYMKKPKNLLGLQFGLLTAVELMPRRNGGYVLAQWRCVCKCGSEAVVASGSLTGGATRSCGCIRKRFGMPGEKYGKLLVIKEAEPWFDNRKTVRKVLCKCDCGNETVVLVASLRSGATQSCGCYIKEILSTGLNMQHGKSGTRLHMLWCNMRARCNRQTHTKYKDYGARGIKVCDRWNNSFEAFCEDVGERPSLRHSIDRIDNNGDYEPGNVRWATSQEQIGNQRKRLRIDQWSTEDLMAELAKRTKGEQHYGRS